MHLNEIFATILCSILLSHPRLPFLLGHFCIPSQLSGLCWSRRFQFIISVSCKQVLFVKQRLAPSIFCITLVPGHSQLTRIILDNDYYYAKDFLTIIIIFWRLNREIKDRILLQARMYRTCRGIKLGGLAVRACNRQIKSLTRI